MQDRRVGRTKAALEECFFELLKEKDYRKISVRELCEKSNINRSTFYAHYADYPEFVDSLETEAARKCMACMERYQYDMDSESVLDDMFDTLRENRNLFSFLFQKRGGKGLGMFMQWLRERTIPAWMEESDITEEQANLLYDYVTGGALVVILRWMNGGYTLDEKVLKETFGNVIKYGVYNYIYTK